MNCPGFFSVIRFCTGIEHSESVNIGVIVGVSGRGMQVRMAEGNKYVEQRFGAEAFDDIRLTLAKLGLVERLKDVDPTVAGFSAFCAAESGSLQLSRPMPMVVNRLDVDVQTLFERLVRTTS